MKFFTLALILFLLPLVGRPETLVSADKNIERSLLHLMSIHCCTFKDAEVDIYKSDEVFFLEIEKKSGRYFKVKYGEELEKEFPLASENKEDKIAILIKVILKLYSPVLVGPVESEKAVAKILNYFEIEPSIIVLAMDALEKERDIEFSRYAIEYFLDSKETTSVESSQRRSGVARQFGFSEDPNLLPYKTVKVFYGTNRNRASRSDFNEWYGSYRDSHIHWGEVYVTIPKTHEHGQVERPSIWRFEMDEDPKKHIVVKKITNLSMSDFIEKINAEKNQAREDSAFIFIHGYNVSFAKAARRTAQIYYDIRFQGVPFMYSWPSNGHIESYVSDSNDARNATDELRQFLQVILKQGSFKKVHVIAHSMGNLLLSMAAKSLGQKEYAGHKFLENIIMAAPDIDEEEFRSQVAEALPETAKQVTIYSSSLDKAILVSSELNGYPRVGGVDSQGNSFIYEGITSVNASGEDMSVFDRVNINHSYYGDSPMLVEISSIVNSNLTPLQRGLRKIKLGDKAYWILRQ